MPPEARPHIIDRLLHGADRYRWWCFGLIGLLYAAGFNGQWRVGSDSAIYMSVGHSLAEGAGYTYNGIINRVIYPGLPWLLATIWRATGTQTDFGPTVAVWVLGLGALALTYRLFFLYADRPTAVVVTCLTCITRLFYRFSFEILSDMLFCVGVMGVLAAYEGLCRPDGSGHPTRYWKRGLNWLMLTAGLWVVVATRPTMWVFVSAVLAVSAWCLLVGNRRRTHAVIMLTTLLCVGAFLLIDPRWSAQPGAPILASVPQYETWAVAQLSRPQSVVHGLFTQHLPLLFEPHLPEAVFGLELGPGLNTLGGVAVLVLGVGLCWVRPLWGVWFTFMILAMLIVGPVVRYTLPLVPLIAFAWWRAVVYLTRRLPLRWSNHAAVVLLMLWCVPNLVRVVDFIVDQRQTPFLGSYKSGRYVSLVELAVQLNDVVGPDAVVVADRSHELAYWAGRPVIHVGQVLGRGGAPSGRVRSVLAAGRGVYIVATGGDRAEAVAKAMCLQLGPKVLVATDQPCAALYRASGRP